MIFGKTFEKRMADLIAAVFMFCTRSMTHFALGKYGEAQHWLGRARQRLDDLQGELSDEISKRRKE